MTRRRGREALGRRSGIGEDKRQQEMARLAVRWRRSNLLTLVTLKDGNYVGKAYVRRGRRKALYKRQRDSIKGPHEEAEMHRKVLRQGKNLVFSENTCLEKERLRSKVTPRKVGVGSKRRRELSRRS